MSLTGDFNSPSWRDWQVKTPQIDWPVSRAFESAGFSDGFRAVHPDPTTLGNTWTAGRPYPFLPDNETFDRIDFTWLANLRAVDSVVMGEPGNPQNALSVMPWPSDHRAVLTTIEVTPIDAPDLITVEPRPVRHGDSFLIRIASPNHDPYSANIYRRGASTPLTGIADVTPDDRPSIRLTTLGLDPGDYDAVMTNADGRELARTRFAIIPRDGPATLQVTAAITPSSDIPLTFAAAPGFKLDWIGISKKADPSVYTYLGFTYTGARINGSLTFPAADLYAPLTPGDYEARLLLDDSYQVLAVAPFTVTAP